MKRMLFLLVLICFLSAPAWADTFQGSILYTVDSLMTNYLDGTSADSILGLCLGDQFGGFYQYDSPTPDFDSTGHQGQLTILPGFPYLQSGEFHFVAAIGGTYQLTVVDGHVAYFHYSRVSSLKLHQRFLDCVSR